MAGTIDPKLIDFDLPRHDGYPEEHRLKDTRDAMMQAVDDAGAAITAFPDAMWVEPRDWPEFARQAKEARTRPIDFIDRFTNQEPTHECTCHSLRACFEAAWNRQRAVPVGPPVAGKKPSVVAAGVWMSCISIYAEANPGQWGGAGVRQVLNIAAKRGFLPDKIQPKEYGFKHTLHGTCGKGNVCQSSGPWTRVSEFPEGWQETAKFFRPKEFIFPDSWEQTVCLVLHGLAVGVGRTGHAVPYAEWIPGDDVMAYVDSYNIVRYDSISRIRSTVGGSFAIASVVTPANWDYPAGVPAGIAA